MDVKELKTEGEEYVIETITHVLPLCKSQRKNISTPSHPN